MKILKISVQHPSASQTEKWTQIGLMHADKKNKRNHEDPENQRPTIYSVPKKHLDADRPDERR